MLGALVAGCHPAASGTLRAQWRSADTTLGRGDLTLPLNATWCGSHGRLMLIAMTGDTGIGILIRTVELAPGLFTVSDTAAARSPGSTIAFRLAEQANLFGLSSDSGAVAITSVDNGRVAGRFVGWFSRPEAGPALLTGSFKGASVRADTVRCDTGGPAPAPAPTPGDSGVT